MPFFGPKNLRDFGGDLIDFYAYPLYYVEVRKLNIVQNKYQGWAAITYKEFNEISLHAEEYKNIRKDALDLYPFIRDLYEKNRENEIKE
jgi:phospholipid-binding lipoprotein MlaA